MKASRSHRESVMEWHRTWNEVDRAGFFELLSPRFVGKGVMAPQGIDSEAIWNMMVAFRETFPDIRWELGDWLVVDGDIAVCHLFESGTFTGRWPDADRAIEPTHRSYRSEAVMLFRFDADGLIVENKSWYDSVDWFHQIGVDPNVGAPPGPAQVSVVGAESRGLADGA
jgi:predicted ester cyclase